MSPARRQYQSKTRTGSRIGPWLFALPVVVAVCVVVVIVMSRGGEAEKVAPSPDAQVTQQAPPPVVVDEPKAAVEEPEVVELEVVEPEVIEPVVVAMDEPEPAKDDDEPLGFTELKPVVASPTNATTRRPPRQRKVSGRSPLLQAGESMEHPIPAPRLDDGPAFSTSPLPAPAEMVPAPKAGEIVPWGEARQHVGRTITVGGKIVLTNNTGSVCFLNFVKDWQGRFYVIILRDALNVWPQAPEDYFANKTIAVTGEVKLRDGTPQIQVRKADQIRIIDDAGK